MNFFTVRDLRTQPRQIWEKLSEVHELIITNNGKPSALMIEIDDENMDDVLASVRQSMAMRATNKLRLASMMSGNSKMSEQEIEAEIKEVRKERNK
jgi:antitoxin (DNA-binding transcriptional repressor) of toxin-antitoxin stability system